MTGEFRHNAKIDLFPLTNGNECAYNGNTNTNGRQRTMTEKQHVLQKIERELADMTGEQKQEVLAFIQKNQKGAA